jgi:hypothetical protein
LVKQEISTQDQIENLKKQMDEQTKELFKQLIAEKGRSGGVPLSIVFSLIAVLVLAIFLVYNAGPLKLGKL